MLFAAEAYLFGGLERYRFQRDESWRDVGSVFARQARGTNSWDQLAETDLLTERLEDLNSRVAGYDTLLLGSQEYPVGYRGQGGQRAYIHFKVLRQSIPRSFKVGELQDVIAEGDPSRINVLVLTLTGHFRLMNVAESRDRLAPVAVRYRFFSRGSNCVGESAAENRLFIAQTYATMLVGWRKHLQSGELGEYVEAADFPGNIIRTLDEISELNCLLQRH